MNSNDIRKDNQQNETHSSKPMDSKGDVERSPDQKTDQDFPGYPHYPAKEDIMDQRSGSHRVDADLESAGTGDNTGISGRFAAPQNPGREADRTEDGEPMELTALHASQDEIGLPQNVSTEDLANDLDIPGADLDDANESIGEEDEENNYYSLGGDRHEAQEENPESSPSPD